MADDNGKLVVFEDKYMFRIGWEFEEDGMGAVVGESWTRHDVDKSPPTDREEWECWMAAKIASTSPGVQHSFGFCWETSAEARAVLRQIKEAFKQDRPLPDWAQKALAEGWKPPKGWKA